MLAQMEADLAARAAAEKPSSPDAIAQARAPPPRAAAAPRQTALRKLAPLPSWQSNPHPLLRAAL